MELLVIGDVHGCLDQLKELLKDVDRSKTRVILCGDLIDRGPNSIGVIDYVRENNIECVLGNHELMFIDTRHNIRELADGEELTPSFTYELKYSDWFYNGGNSVFNQYNGDYSKMLADLDFLNSFPTFIRTGVGYKGKEVVVSHAMILDYIDEDCTADHSTLTLVWDRNQFPLKTDLPFFNVYGHTPVDYAYARETNKLGRPVPQFNKYESGVNLDTGAPYNDRLRGYLSGMYFPSGKVIQVKTFKD